MNKVLIVMGISSMAAVFVLVREGLKFLAEEYLRHDEVMWGIEDFGGLEIMNGNGQPECGSEGCETTISSICLRDCPAEDCGTFYCAKHFAEHIKPFGIS